ncbi:Cold-shock DEAD box protein A [Desulfamplus magnetovallimortis]|uniref:ATP-dependent RNA helicase DeaD n=1 Tax=Desulfamplus magnetovallimortis TaxID=1246637 RepID=A0A1W1H902_9BACT|nr:DEAD/DEAH box helicase [Desulfamplus magnetovallimortis]SLM28929.1 Cold-shock DEAD box protein A [Desulfamplus magnetovallimortis]
MSIEETSTCSNESHSHSIDSSSDILGFAEMGLEAPVLKAVKDQGYETPTTIQSRIIPHVLAGRDVLGQAQTGTGKTAAFALPLLCRIDIKEQAPQVLVITPTRELAIQVAESFKAYSARIKNFHVLPIYGGQSYEIQLKQLKRGVHVVVGTPGRVMDHMRRGTLKLDSLKCLVLDEADEMLRMGFIDDVKWILEQTPDDHQMALFSATMPPAIRAIARQYLKSPEEVTIKLRTTTADTIRQRFWMVKGVHKLDALTRILEAEDFDAMLVFVRTKTATIELADKLEARGYATEALNGDIAQKSRERTIDRLKKGKIDIVVATDVAARGLDVDRVSHVINYDIPTEAESYIHRIGRTGRAGRQGDAILFVSPRERWMLRVIEKATRQKLELMNLPSTRDIADRRIADFKQRITDALSSEDISFYRDIVDQYRQERDEPAIDIAAALAAILHKDKPLAVDIEKALLPESVERTTLPEKSEKTTPSRKSEKTTPPRKSEKTTPTRKSEKTAPPRKNERTTLSEKSEKTILPKKSVSHEKNDILNHEEKKGPRAERKRKEKDIPIPTGMNRFSIAVGHEHDVKPGEIVGVIASKAGLEPKFIGNITISEHSSTVDLPDGMPDAIFKILKKAKVAGQTLDICKVSTPQKKKKQKQSVQEKPRNRVSRKPRKND